MLRPLQELQDAAFAFAEEQQLTNEQTISFTIALMVNKGHNYKTAFDFVLFPGAFDTARKELSQPLIR